MESINLITALWILAFAVVGAGVAFFAIRKTGPGPEASAEGLRRRRLDMAKTEAALTKAEAALADAETALAAAELTSRAKSDFLATISHEIRTPLHSILGFTEIMENEMFGALGSKRYANYIHDINISAEYLLGIVNDILDLSKVEAGRMEPKEETVDLAEVIEEVANLVREQADAQGIVLKTALPESLPPLRADGRMVRQMLINLLSNAIDFTSPDGWIAMTAERDLKGGIVLAVADAGVGIAPENISRVLEPFQTIGGPFGRSRRRTGLGLPLVKSLIELHGGTFFLKSTPGVGTTVALGFPPDRVAEGRLEELGKKA